MPESNPTATARRSLPERLLRRILFFVVIAILIGTTVNAMVNFSQKLPGPAGFGRGVLHGALMPIALPNLLIGRDVVIYAPENTGRTYKLGYTVGVNGCGAVFFGVMFIRLQRWRARIAKSASGLANSRG